MMRDPEYMTTADEEILIIPQTETKEAWEHKDRAFFSTETAEAPVRMRSRLKNRVHAQLDGRDIDLHVPLSTRRGHDLLRCLVVESIRQLTAVIDVQNPLFAESPDS